jgi:hypothetical protein
MAATQEAETVEVRGRGQPTKYDPAYCDVVVDLGKQGYSRAMMASHLGVCKATITVWSNAHPDFLNALKLADSHAQAWYEQRAHEGLTGGNFNANLFKIIAYNRFRDDYADRKEVKVEANHLIHHSVLQSLAAPQVIDGEAEEVEFQGDE